jgi:integration host factor subunit beta
MEDAITKSEIINALSEQQRHLGYRDVEFSVKAILDHLADNLAENGRIEIRGFGSFTLRYRKPRMGRNPKTGEAVELDSRYVAYFKPGKEMRERVNNL